MAYSVATVSTLGVARHPATPALLLGALGVLFGNIPAQCVVEMSTRVGL